VNVRIDTQPCLPVYVTFVHVKAHFTCAQTPPSLFSPLTILLQTLFTLSSYSRDFYRENNNASTSTQSHEPTQLSPNTKHVLKHPHLLLARRHRYRPRPDMGRAHFLHNRCPRLGRSAEADRQRQQRIAVFSEEHALDCVCLWQQGLER
jgi:hypothetical protein